MCCCSGSADERTSVVVPLVFVRRLTAARNIRTTVFVEEQGFSYAAEFDDVDASSTHLVLLECGKPIATCRFFRQGDGVYAIGRIAVLKEYRGSGMGAAAVRAAEKMIAAEGGRVALVHAQTRASGFYEKLGYEPFGEPDEDEGVPHVWMRRAL